MKIAKDNLGIALLLTMVIITIILAAAGSFATIIIREIRQTKAVENSLIAYYYAESGAEETLYQIRKVKADPTSLSTSCDLDGECARSVTQISSATKEFLGKNQTWQIDLINPSALAADQPEGVESIRLTCNPQSGSPYIKLTVLELNTSGGQWDATSGNSVEYIYPCDGTTITNNSLSNARSYIITIQALYNDTNNLIFTAWENDNGGGDQRSLASLLQIDFEGKQSNIVQKIKITMPQRSPLSSIFSWVLFSEDNIEKSL